jgi:uncharacterized protein
VAACLSKSPLKERLGFLPQTGRKFGLCKVATMGCFTLSIALAAVILTSLFLGAPSANNPISNAISDGSWVTITLVGVLLSLIPALVEETLFRGYLQRRLLERWSPVAAIATTTVLFAMMHFDSLQHIIAVVPLGLITGLLAYHTNSTKPGMVVHAVHNVGAVLYGAAATRLLAHFPAEVVGLMLIGFIITIGIIGLLAVMSLVRRPKAPTMAETPVVVRPAAPSLPSFGIDSRLAGQMG